MTPRLELREITKRYPGVLANDRISIAIAPGEIHAVLGENGAGKSTLMKIIYGASRADSGDILFEGKRIERHDPGLSRALGIEMVYQHFSLFETATVVENIAAAAHGRFDLRALARRIESLGAQYGMAIDPQAHVHDLSVGERQRVEILRCLLEEPKLLILDEPTSVLAPPAIENLFRTLRRLAQDGCSILYISHKLDEIRDLCDTATVLRGGAVTGIVDPRQATSRELARLMVGSDVPVTRTEPAAPGPSPVLEICGLSARSSAPFGTDLEDIALAVHPGEIVGIAGVSGNGQRELVALLSGETPHARADAILIDGRQAGRLDAAGRRRLGLAFVPEERLGRGAVPPLSLAENAILTAHGRGLVRRGFLRRGRAAEFASRVIARFDVRTRGIRAAASSLSGGNLQKFIVGREIELEPRILLVSQPTWGVDVGAAATIRQTLVDISRAGAAVLVFSEELDEILEIADRIQVMHKGRLSAALAREAADRETVGLMMGGQMTVGRPTGESADQDRGGPDGGGADRADLAADGGAKARQHPARPDQGARAHAV